MIGMIKATIDINELLSHLEEEIACFNLDHGDYRIDDFTEESQRKIYEKIADHFKDIADSITTDVI